MNKRKISLTCFGTALVVLAGCASPGHHNAPRSASYPATYPSAYPASQPASRPYPQSSPSYAQQYGTVDSIQYRQANGGGGGIGVGAVVGGVLGGVLGNQVGGGNGKKVATVAGVIGGAMVGNEVENRNAQIREEVVVGVRLDNGSYRTVAQESAAGLQVGARVRIENDRVIRYN